jgi:hypothetical protein
MVELKSKPVETTSVYDSLIYKMNQNLANQFQTHGSVNAADVEKLNNLKDKRYEISKSR